jgi:hypothetical protein
MQWDRGRLFILITENCQCGSQCGSLAVRRKKKKKKEFKE